MAITSESQLIDMTKINDGCAIIERAAEDYVTCANRIREAASTCSAEALAVEGKSMQPSLQDLAVEVEKIKTYIEDFTREVKALSSDIFNEQSKQLQAYREGQNNN